MIGLCRAFLGQGWQPDLVEVKYPRDCDAWRVEERLQAPIVFGRPGVGIALRARDLAAARADASLAPHRPIVLRDLRADLVLAQAAEPARSLSALVSMRLMDGKTDIEGAAEMARLSVQQLQRRLREKGYTYREVLEAARMARAQQLLASYPSQVVDVAMQLGYQEHASFTRAFKRWFGVSPSAYRQSARSTEIAGPFEAILGGEQHAIFR